MITIVLPCYNEQEILKDNTLQVFNFCQKNLSDEWQIVISDNGSTDGSQAVGQELAHKFLKIKYFKSAKQGKGYGVIEAWQRYLSEVYIFMDVDLATDLTGLPQLIRGIRQGLDVIVGSRFNPESQVSRSFKRKIFSLGLRLILKVLFNLKIKDAPCGFKAVNHRVVQEILPKIKNKTWFFDTEMLILSQRRGLCIEEIPIVWRETARQSKVNSLAVIKDYLKNIYRLYAHQ